MSTQYPAGFDTFPSPNATDPASNPSVSGTYKNLAASVLAIETELGQNPSGVYTDVTTRFANLPTGGGGGSGSVFQFTLSSGITRGTGSSFGVVETIPVEMANYHGMRVLLNPGGTNSEVVAVNRTGANSFLFGPTTFANHTAGEKAYLLPDANASIFMFGALADQNSDDAMPVQRAFLASSRAGIIANGGRSGFFVQQPVWGMNGLALREASINTYATWKPPIPIRAAGGCHNAASIMRSITQISMITADPTSDRIKIIDDGAYSTVSVGNRIAFNAPYGETLPGGVQTGQIYFVNAKFDGTHEIEITATRNSGTRVDITSAGSSGSAGVAYTSFSTLCHWFIHDCKFSVGDTLNGVRTRDLNLVHCKLQQQSEIQNCYFNVRWATNYMGCAGLIIGNDADSAYGEGTPSGQLANMNNITFATPYPDNQDAFSNALALDVSGFGYYFAGLTSINGTSPHLRISGSQHQFDGCHFENWNRDAVTIGPGGCGLVTLGQVSAQREPGTSARFIYDPTDGDGSIRYEAMGGANWSDPGVIYQRDNNGSPGPTSITLLADSGAFTDFMTLGRTYAPKFGRYLTNIGASHFSNPATATWNIRTWIIDTESSTGHDVTFALPSCVGMDGGDFEIIWGGGTHTITIDPFGSEGIGGIIGQTNAAATYLLDGTAGKRSVILRAYNGNWYVAGAW